jgi:hypothetical protein
MPDDERGEIAGEDNVICLEENELALREDKNISVWLGEGKSRMLSAWLGGDARARANVWRLGLDCEGCELLGTWQLTETEWVITNKQVRQPAA